MSPSMVLNRRTPSLEELVKAARGLIPVDLLIEGVNYVNLFTGEIYEASIGIIGDRIAYVYTGDSRGLEARRRIGGGGLYAIPGLIDSHLHIESSMVTPPRFAEAVLPRGVTTVAIDPHEIANVLGKMGVRYMLESSEGLPLKIYILAPTCVPSLPGRETSGAEITAEDVEEMLSWGRVIGLAEVMDFHGVLNLDSRIIGILEAGRRRRVVIDGHAYLSGLDLNAYIAAGMEADHENLSFGDALEKMRLGMLVKLRAPYVLDVDEFAKGLRSLPRPFGYLLVTDDVLPDNLDRDGHLDHVVRRFIEAGLDPIDAIRAATLLPALHLRLYDRGSISPGKLADVVLLGSLERFSVKYVIADGILIAEDGRLIHPIPFRAFPDEAKRTVRIERLTEEDFRIRAPPGRRRVRVRAIELLQPESGSRLAAEFAQSLVTRFSIEELEVVDGYVDPGELAVVAVIERHGRTRGSAKGLVKNSGLRAGAVASTIAHDSHNLVVIGRSPRDMLRAAEHVVRSQGGVAVALDGEVVASVELPVAGLMSEEPVEVVAEKFKRVREAFRRLGLRDHPYAPPIFFLALPVIPAAKITDKGLFDVLEQRLVPLFLDN